MQLNGRNLMKLVGAAVDLWRSSRRESAPAPRGTGKGRRPARSGPPGLSAGAGVRPAPGTRHQRDSTRSARPGGLESPSGSWENGRYPGDFGGQVRPVYRPQPDGEPDPGEVVWAWVPYEEDHSRGKDRPVLLVGRDGDYLLGLMLTSRDRNTGLDRDEDYVDVGTGAWDSKGRPSEAKIDRVVRLLPSGIRREGAVLGEDRFTEVARRLSGR